MICKRTPIFLLFILIVFQAKSQNLIPNPGFENTTTAPCDVIQSSTAFSGILQNWTLPTDGTSDIYSRLAPFTCYAYCPYQAPRTGNNFVGFYSYGSPEYNDYREYVEVKLISPLLVGRTYYVEMYVSASEARKYGTSTNNIGMYFSTDLINDPNMYTALTSFTPQVKSSAIITDVTNWVKISGTFVATTPARYLTIGNFNDSASTTIQIKNTNSNYGAYYFLDDVLVKYICNPKDSLISVCKGNSVTLSSNESNIVSWALASAPNNMLSNTPDLVVSPQITTSYIAYHDCGQTSLYEVVVHDVPGFTFGNDTIICSGEMITFDATSDNATYLWQDGSTDPVYTVTNPGNYAVTIKNNCGISNENISFNLCCTDFIIPDLITPNGDGMNETFYVDCFKEGVFELVIYNIWGALVYRNTTYTNNWGGNNVSDGIYYYVIKYKTKPIHNGWVQVLR